MYPICDLLAALAERHGELKHSVQGQRLQPCSGNLGQLSPGICSSASKEKHRCRPQMIRVSVSSTLLHKDKQDMVNSSQ